ncbi:MAG: choice-of-anchor B family protein [Flavobacteriales bacterium]|nr:choice-of-anchor B family protein [Flavobacteriales bacterium]
MLKQALLGLGVLATMLPADAQDSLNVHKLFNWQDASLPIGTSELQNKYNEVWGYAANGREYAFIGSTWGIHILDVTDPTATVLVDQVQGRYSGPGVIHRDLKTHAGHLYAVCDQGPSSLQIMDLSHLPDSVHVVYDSNALLARAHNIQVDTINARLYTCGGSNQFSVYSIADPAAPVLLANLEVDVPWWNALIGYVHDCHVRDNIVWTNDANAMHVVDFTDPLEPVVLGALTSYADQGYNHSGWLNDEGTTYVMADETHGSPLKFIDVTDIGDLDVTSSVSTGTSSFAIVHNPFFKGNVAHVAYYHDGYWLWDATDPMDPQVLGYYDTNPAPSADNYRGAWGVYPYLPSGRVLVSDMQTGLWVFDIDQSTALEPDKSRPHHRIALTVTSDHVVITPLSPTPATLHIQVVASNGQTVRTLDRTGSGTVVLDLSPLATGLYIVAVNDGSSHHHQRILKTDRP